MGIKSSSVTFTRFFVPEPITEDFWTYVDEKLKAGVFREPEDGQEKVAGFSSWDDFFDSSFADIGYHKGEYVAFQFRVDKKKVPAIITKQYVREAIQKYRQEHEGKWPSRKEKLEIQENVAQWLLTRAFPQPSACEVVWNPAGKWMLLGTSSSSMIDNFLEYFENCFRLFPVPLYHVHWALNLLPLDGRQKDALASMVSVQSPAAMDEGRFLGYEFLTWLWYFTETLEGLVRISEDRSVECHLGERLVLTLPGDGKERVTCTTQASALHEARTALKQGKLVEQIQLFLRIGDNEYTFNLDSSLWAVKGLKTPKQLPNYEEEDPDGRFIEKMYFLEEVLAVLNFLYEKFLSERLSPGWESDTLPLLRQWIDAGTDGSPVLESRKEAVGAAPF